MLSSRMMPRKKKSARSRQRFVSPHRVARLCLLLALVCYVLFLLEEHIRPVLLTVVEYESKRYAMSAFNDAVAELIQENPDVYQGLYVITYASDGTIAAVQADTYALNRLSSQLTEKVEARMNQMEDSDLTVPIGTLLGIQALAGRGPRLKMHVLPETYVCAQVYDTLASAGINQTKLCVYVHFSMDMSVILSGYSTCIEAKNDICLSQILLVGNTPQSYWGTGRK